MTLNIEALVADTLLERQAESGGRPIDGGQPFRASKLGSPFCEQILAAKGAVDRVYDARALATFEMGHIHAEFLGEVFRENDLLVKPSFEPLAGVAGRWEMPLGATIPKGVTWDTEYQEWALQSDDLLLGAHIDFVLKGGIGVELKSMRSDSFWGKPATARSYGTDYGRKGKYGLASKPEHRIQAAACAMLATHLDFQPNGEPITDWRVVVISKDDLSIADEPITAEDVKAAEERLTTLQALWREGTIPACTCDEVWGGRYVKYCSSNSGDTCCGR